MHPLRQDIAEGKVPRKPSPLAQKEKKGGEALQGSLTRISIARNERRQSHQRHEDRFVVSDANAIALWRGGESEVRIVNLSSNGLMIETPRQPEIGERVRLQLAGCNPISCWVRWVRDGRIGLEFAVETEILADSGVRDYLLNEISLALGGPQTLAGRRVGVERRDRGERHGMIWVGGITLGDRIYPVRLRNVSSSGAMVAAESPLGDALGQRVTLELGAAGSVSGIVKWASEYEFGMEFTTPFDVAQLAQQPAVSAHEVGSGDEGGVHEAGHFARQDPGYDLYTAPPEMEYRALTLDEVYATLYPGSGKVDP
jgi:hypothetical protein